ncbi:MAG: DMT family transporter [Bacillota bacterium]|nr:DMT family transporter [Bacillota bacterium]
MHPSPYAVLGAAVVSVSFSSLFIRLSSAPPLAIAAYRMGFTTLILAALLVRFDRGALSRLSGKELAWCFASGSFLALHFATWITSLFYTTVASSTVLVSLQPLFVMAGSHFLYRERVPPLGLAAAGLAIAGSALIGGGDVRAGGASLWGDVLAFTGAAMVAGYVLIGRRLRQKLSLLGYTVPVYGVCSLLLFLMSALNGQRLTGFPGRDWLLFLALAVVPTIGGHTLYNYCLRYLPAHVVSVASLGEPVGASLLVLALLGEVPAVTTMLGGVLVLGGIAWFLILTAPPVPRR